MKGKRILVWLWGLLVFSQTVSGEALPDWKGVYPSGGVVALTQAQYGGRVEATFRLLQDVPGQVITLTVWQEGDLENLVLDSSSGGTDLRELTLILKGTEDVRASSYRILDESQSWHPHILFQWNYGKQGAVWTGGVLAWPFDPQGVTRIIQGHDGDFTHKGEIAKAIDFGLPEGTPVWAVRAGLVVSVVDTFSGAGTTEEYRTRNNIVDVLHEDGTVARYVHLQTGTARVQAGQRVQKGQVLALSGNVGFSDGPHLHFEIGRPVDGRRWETLAVPFVSKDKPEGEIPLKGWLVGERISDPWDLEATGFSSPVVIRKNNRFLIPIARPGATGGAPSKVQLEISGPGPVWKAQWNQESEWEYQYVDWNPTVSGIYHWKLSRNGKIVKQGQVKI